MNRLFISSVALAAVGLCGAVSAQVYVGIQVGTSRADIDCSGTTSCDKSDTSFKLLGGYKLTPEWGLEVGYTDLGEISGSAVVPGVGLTNLKIEGTSLGFGAAYHIPFSADWNGVARFGIARNKADLTVVAGSQSGSESQSKTKPYLGFGVGYALSKELSLTGVWDWTELEFEGEKAKTNSFSIGLNWAF